MAAPRGSERESWREGNSAKIFFMFSLLQNGAAAVVAAAAGDGDDAAAACDGDDAAAAGNGNDPAVWWLRCNSANDEVSLVVKNMMLVKLWMLSIENKSFY